MPGHDPGVLFWACFLAFWAFCRCGGSVLTITNLIERHAHVLQPVSWSVSWSVIIAQSTHPIDSSLFFFFPFPLPLPNLHCQLSALFLAHSFHPSPVSPSHLSILTLLHPRCLPHHTTPTLVFHYPTTTKDRFTESQQLPPPPPNQTHQCDPCLSFLNPLFLLSPANRLPPHHIPILPD